jgi:uncharacterized Zn-binding protein involved in type VI secretion
LIDSPFICDGDRTTCGGVVVQASPTDDVGGRGIAYVTCRIACEYNCIIISGDPTFIIQGRSAAHFQGSQSSRGCQFVPQQRTSGLSRTSSSDGAESAAPTMAADFVLPIIPETKELLEQPTFVELRLVNQQQCRLGHEPFSLTASDGRVVNGTLDENGFARVDDMPCGDCVVEFTRLGVRYNV